jgi:hypothetical protein
MSLLYIEFGIATLHDLQKGKPEVRDLDTLPDALAWPS